MKPFLLISLVLLQLMATAATKVFWITTSGAFPATPGTIHPGDTIAWANMTSYTFTVTASMSPSGSYPFSCSTVTCKYVPLFAGNYTYFCSSVDYTSFSGSFTVEDPASVLEPVTKPDLFTCTPNPAKNQLQFAGIGKYLVTLYDLLGNKVAEYDMIDSGTMDITALPTGTYLVSALNSGHHTTQRVVVYK